MDVRKVCVIGAGTMGGGIAAHLANLGFEVSLLDQTRESVTKGFDRTQVAKPPHFLTSQVALGIKTAGLKDGYSLIREADWICEAIIEKEDAKKALYAEIADLVKPGAFLTTNTSGLEISRLSEGLPARLKGSFVGTHFFNPPRYLKLLELIPTHESDPAAVQQIAKFLEDRVARRVVIAKDTPGFIANRYGMWAMFHAIHSTEKLQLTVEQVDAMTGPFLGRPKSASFRLNDIVGLDVMQDIARNLLARCPDDPHVKFLNPPASLHHLLEQGWIGEKVKQGYYRREGSEFLSFDLGTRAYRQRQEPDLPSLNAIAKLPLGDRIREALSLRDEVGEFMRLHLVPVLQYADYLKEEISHAVEDFDRVMMWGFGWQAGPFEMIDAIGAEHLGIKGTKFYSGSTQRAFDGTYVPRAVEPQYRPITDYPLVEQGETYNLRDLGDGVTALTLTTKMGVISPRTVEELHGVLDRVDNFVFTSEARSFSAGFDLNFFLDAIYREDLDGIDLALGRLQTLGEKFATKRAVAAIYGHCLGAGWEMAFSCPVVVASVETQIGLPEAKVGLLPGGRGATLMRLNNQGSAKRLAEVAGTLAQGLVATNSEQARQLGYFRANDVTSFHPDRLLVDAKAVLQGLVVPEAPRWAPVAGPVTGMIEQGFAELKDKGKLTVHDVYIGERLKVIFSKTNFYEDALIREREEFLDLCGKALSVARIKHMLDTGKPLSN